MTSLSTHNSAIELILPSGWAQAIEPLLEPEEKILAWVEPDLDQQLFFATGALLLTSRRLLARDPGAQDWLTWPISAAQSLQHKDHAGVGTIELFSDHVRLGVWRHTLSMTPAVRRLSDLFSDIQQTLLDPTRQIEADAAACPTCGTPFAPDHDDCAVCNSDPVGPSTTWALLRLARFARPYRTPLLIGFILTLLSTAATLVPPYLTMPLMDKILIPFQNGQPIDYDLVALYLTGLVVSALLAAV